MGFKIAESRRYFLTKVLVLGSSGMLGNAMLRVCSDCDTLSVTGAVRSQSSVRFFEKTFSGNLLAGFDAGSTDSILKLFNKAEPDVVINCVGLVKQLDDASDPLQAISINALLPHRLAVICGASGARLIHFSTDCVFSGQEGFYKESDVPDASDLYGRSKLLGEVDYPHAVTLRTSIIGHELNGHRSLLDWFLFQEGRVDGYRKAVFSGLTTVELAKVVRDYVIPAENLCGVYHVAAQPINKYALLRLVSDVYGKEILINPCDDVVMDRSLNASRFNEVTGYVPPSWPDLIRGMHEFQ